MIAKLVFCSSGVYLMRVLCADISTVSDGQLVASSARRLAFGLHTILAQLGLLLEARGVASLGASALEVLRNAILRVTESAAKARTILSKVSAAHSPFLQNLPEPQKTSASISEADAIMWGAPTSI